MKDRIVISSRGYTFRRTRNLFDGSTLDSTSIKEALDELVKYAKILEDGSR